jgi:hypothetical protein
VEPRRITPELLHEWTVEWITRMDMNAKPSKNEYLAQRINYYMNPPTIKPQITDEQLKEVALKVRTIMAGKKTYGYVSYYDGNGMDAIAVLRKLVLEANRG